jgi:nucleotide-binding universal stress UspA family protein
LVKNILAPIDGSKYMEKNVLYACEIAKSTGAKLTFLHVVSLPHLVPPEPQLVEPAINLDISPFQEAGSRLLETVQNLAKKNGVDSDGKLETVYGSPTQIILGVAEAGKYDLIVMGSKGHSLLRNLTVGSVCDTVVRNAPCPVLVVR